MTSFGRSLFSYLLSCCFVQYVQFSFAVNSVIFFERCRLSFSSLNFFFRDSKLVCRVFFLSDNFSSFDGVSFLLLYKALRISFSVSTCIFKSPTFGVAYCKESAFYCKLSSSTSSMEVTAFD